VTSNSQAVLPPVPVPGSDVTVDYSQPQPEIAGSDPSPVPQPEIAGSDSSPVPQPEIIGSDPPPVPQLNDREKPLPPEPEPSDSGDRDDAASKQKLVALPGASEGGGQDLKKKRFSVFKLPFKTRSLANASKAKESGPGTVEKLREIPVSRKALKRNLRKVHPYQYFDDPEEGDETDVLEVWFAGCHGGMCSFLSVVAYRLGC
jgi:hypothetical protein